MERVLRVVLLVGAVFGLAMAALYIVQSPIVRSIWPWSGGYGTLTPLSNIFIASIAASVALPNFLVMMRREYAALRAGAINLLVTFGAVTIFCAQSYAATPNNTRLLVAAVVCALYTAASLGILVWSMRIPFRDKRPTPTLVRISFAGFAIALILVGGALVLKQPNIFPWTLRAEVSVVYGWIFLGAAAYFMYALARPYWGNAAGQLIGFLAYDLVLIVPFLSHFNTVRDSQRLSLTIYTAVLLYSGALAIFYLFINPATRIWGARVAAPAPTVGQA